jgi:tetratricopeptide (TPR) repeat protein
MAKVNKEDTQSIKIKNAVDPAKSKTHQVKLDDTQSLKVKKPKLWRVILTGILLTLLLGTAGGALGYRQGIQDRLNEQRESIIKEAALQYQYGLQQMNNGNYNLARTHFEYVLENYPDFPGITEKYTEVMIKITESMIPTATPAPTPTPDMRGVETLFTQASQEVQSQQWEAAMTTLETLRNEDYTYRTLDVDGLYFIAMRYRAIQMILNEGNLEEGLYYLALLERYAPLDKDAVNYSTWARLYLTGASYWDLDWSQVVNYFSQLAGSMPGLNDGSMTANQRYMEASVNYGDVLANKHQYCEALTHYQNSLNISALDTTQQKYNEAYKKCYPPTKEPTEEVIEETPEEEVTEEPTEEITEVPTEETPAP